MRAHVAAVTAAMLLGPLVPGAAFHQETCSADGAGQMSNVLDAGYVFGGVVDPGAGFPAQGGEPHRWRVTLGPGQHVLLLQSTFNVDVVVCKDGELRHRHACTSDNFALVPEACLVDVGTEVGIGAFHVERPLVGPGTFVAYVYYCSGFDCGWNVNVPAVAYAGVVVV